ncbi:hypothetical protein ACH46N_26270 [Streptomyces pristinaespiralis]|uniref:Integral membrane protein n=2 Tax=Streptomyces pristinaespiralis TaxID=38300 RepID=B5HCD1_STRE2|nr:hypothetical protein [Streptomyces pristinaespiralis]ALC23105.1 membrane protein [Streptomyces pristinaespiralis]EDY64492.1 integral membrane protein [Streptomyces pristinaespiralis ATCC 25486]QMU14377.1 hypothetical protein H3L99_12830 [Streptomyces pristinaespiralis]
MTSSTRSTGTAHAGRASSAWATGGTIFAGVLLLMEGILNILSGIAAIAEDDVYTRVGDYVFKFNLTTWGWIHLILGIVVAVTGWGILRGAAWARGLGVGVAALVVVLQFMWLPYQPVWAVVSIAIGLFVIWALCTDQGRRSQDGTSAH